MLNRKIFSKLLAEEMFHGMRTFRVVKSLTASRLQLLTTVMADASYASQSDMRSALMPMWH